VARAVFAILGGSQWLSDTLIHFPQLLDLAAQRSLLEQPRSREEARAACRDYCLAFRDRRAALRRWKAREMLRIGLRDLAMDAPAPEITSEIADLAQACISFASDEIRAARRPASENVAFAVLGMGKFGGGAMHYSSDADVIFVCDPALDEEVGVREATGWAEELMRFCGERTEDGLVFEIDPRLRPDGRSGPLVRTVQGFVDYFERASNGIAVWERQALTRARFVAGDAATAGRLMAAINHVAFPAEWQPGWGDELRHIKGRVENERAARGTKSGGVYDVKLGPGCLSDIEFCAQWLALKDGARVPSLQTPISDRRGARGGAAFRRRSARAVRNLCVPAPRRVALAGHAGTRRQGGEGRFKRMGCLDALALSRGIKRSGDRALQGTMENEYSCRAPRHGTRARRAVKPSSRLRFAPAPLYQTWERGQCF
jgi:glutamate-ammonia-ligase adenylyltransferase